MLLGLLGLVASPAMQHTCNMLVIALIDQWFVIPRRINNLAVALVCGIIVLYAKGQGERPSGSPGRLLVFGDYRNRMRERGPFGPS
jgi:hypothetical protein